MEELNQPPLLIHKALQHANVALFVARLIYGSLGNEGCVGKARIVQQTAEWLNADGSLSNVLMPVEL